MAPLSRRIRLVFITQALIASVLITAGTLLAAQWVSNSILGTRMSHEAASVWEMLERDALKPLPNTTAMRSYFVPRVNGDDSVVPAKVRNLAPGIHQVQGEFRMAYVGERQLGRLYILMAPGATDRIVSSVSWTAIGMALLAIALLSWLSYRRCQRLVEPISNLSEQVAHWDPRTHQAQAFDLKPDQRESSNEVAALRTALNDMTGRVDSHILREANFTRDASHEFRTPLTVIRMAADLLSVEQSLSERGQRSLRRILHASGEMETVLDALLILARDPALPVENVDVPVQEIVQEQVEMARQRLRDKPVLVHVEVDAVPQVQAPLRVLGVMLGHLVRNAVDFTETGSITVHVQADSITVSDTGIGMNEDTLERIYEPFYRADISNTSAKGMGLPVTHRLAERFGWHLHFDSTPGQGTRASIVFSPVAQRLVEVELAG